MSIDIKELQKQFPLCKFGRCGSRYTAKFTCGFTSIFSVDKYSYDNLKHIYDTNEYVMNFLKANGFIGPAFSPGGTVVHKKLSLYIYVTNLKYQTSPDIKYYDADGLIEMVKRELDIQVSYKPVIGTT